MQAFYFSFDSSLSQSRSMEQVVPAVHLTFYRLAVVIRDMSDIYRGRVNPSGKLPLTFPKKYQDTPTYLNFPGDGYQVNYGEGIYVGYRYYDKKMVEPLYPFGHGLSYSHFEISNERAIGEQSPVEIIYPDGKVDNKKMPVFTDSIKIAVDVINQGPEEFSEGMEVVQLYISDPYASISKPVKELKAFKKIRLAYGEREKVTFTLTKEDFASFDSDLHQCCPPKFTVKYEKESVRKFTHSQRSCL